MKNPTEKPSISIIIPVYNTGKAAAKLINKILGDKITDYEVLAIDDGSTDDSLKFLRGIKDPRVRILSKKNGGAASARNLGLKYAEARYVIFLDSDDDISPKFLNKLFHAIMNPGVKLAVTGIRYKRLRQKTTKDVYISPLKPRSPKETWPAYILRLLYVDGRLYSSVNKIFHTAIIKEHNLKFNEKINFAEDTEFVLDYLKYAEGKIEFIPEALYIYNYGTDTSTVSSSSLQWSNWQQSYDFLVKWLGSNPTSSEKKALKRVRFRWRISHALAVARSNKPFKEKMKLVNPLLLILATLLVRVRS